MHFLIVTILVLAVFLLVVDRKSKSSVCLICVLISYLFLFAMMILYLSKNSHDMVTQYFSLPDEVWRRVFYIHMNRFWVIRLLHLSDFVVIFFSCRFAYVFYMEQCGRVHSRLRVLLPAVAVYGGICLVLFDPDFQIGAYYLLYPEYLLPSQFTAVQNGIQTAARAINVGLLLFGVVLMLVSVGRVPRIRTIQWSSAVLTVSYVLFCMLHMVFFSFVPAYFLKISKFNDSYRFLQVKVSVGVEVYRLLPYFLVFMIAAIAFSMLRLSRISSRLSTRDFMISRQISASETTSKVFCHYIKNELLAILSQIEDIPHQGREEEWSELKNRCENLYNRVDVIHRSTKTEELHLKEQDLREIVTKTQQTFDSELHSYTVHLSLPEKPVDILADPEYMQQALHNLIRNALDAMEELPPERKNLTICLRCMEQWAVLEIQDTGTGIAPQNLSRIFTPFFSSQPFARHWGIGLSLTYKLIKAHEGRIEVESEYGKGTVMKVVLPCLNR